ncbi:MAG: DEAD/DEAH box helicase [Desulfohalobiaceae bacterium]|nr:DEAD/DEAH box helicase [Desulfohalobiaceae bacterium]
MKTKDTSNGLWQDSLKHYFPRTVRTRGDSYASKGRVNLKRATKDVVAGSVQGSRAYSVEIALDSEDKSQFRVLCTCPHFRRGNACKHLWAALVAADRKLQGKDISSPVRKKAKPSLTEHPPPERKDPPTGKREPEKTRNDWRNALFPGESGAGKNTSRWNGTPGGFLLCYELRLTDWTASLLAYQQYIRKNGEPGRSRGVEQKLLMDPLLPHEDQIVLKTLQAASPGGLISSFPGGAYMLSRRDLSLLAPYLARTGRCTVSLDGSPLAAPLRPGDPFHLQARFVPEGKRPSRAKTLSLKAVLVFSRKDGEKTSISLESLPLVFGNSPLFCISGEQLHQIHGLSGEQLETLRYESYRIQVPREDLTDFVEALETSHGAPAVELPDKLRFREESGISPVPTLRLEITGDSLWGEVAFDYGVFLVSPQEQRQRLLDRKNWRVLIRNNEVESQRLTELGESGFEPNGNSYTLPLQEAPEPIRVLAEQGWRVEGKDGQKVRGGSTPSMKISSSEMDWFDLEGEVDFSGTSLDLSLAIQEFLQGNRTVRLDDGSLGMLPLDWLRRHAGELSLGLEKNGRNHRDSGQKASLRYHKAQALALDNLVQQDQGAELESHFLRIRDQLRSFEGLEPSEPPQEFRGILREYQKEGLSWFEFLTRFGFGGVLADDMGLGKTIQVLALLQQRKQTRGYGPSLVVAPASLMFNWREEAGRFAPQLKVVSHIGPQRATKAKELEQADLVLTTYGTLRKDASLLRKIEFDCAVLDESQAIKNNRSKTFQAAKALRSRHRLCLTGTPLENKLAELWSQMDFLNPGLLRSSSRFEQSLAGPISRGDAKAGESLRQLIKPFILRRTKEQVAPELPDKAEHTLNCPMLGDQSRLYQQVLAYYRESVLQAVDAQGMNRSKIKVLEGLLRLRQIACHPGLVDPQGTDSGKMHKLRELVREVRSGGRKALIFSQYTKLLSLIKKEFDQQGLPYFSLDGRTTQKLRKQRVEAFQEEAESCFFLISLKAGGTGLNLTAADYVFILDPWWNPAVETQAVDRTHRIGQEKKVVSYRLISEGSVEEKVLSLQEKKQEMVNSVLSGSNDMIKNLTRGDLEHLFS